MEDVKISVIMPSLNVEKYIDECVQSVLNQSLKEIEIICVDAGSTDGTLEKLKSYEANDKRVKVIISDKKSYGYQMNLGLSLAKGEYVGIVETDDFIEKRMYEKLYSMAKETNVDYVNGGYYLFADSPKKHVYANSDRDIAGEECGKKIELGNQMNLRMKDMGGLWRSVYRRTFLEEKNIKFHETLGASYQDVGFLIQVYLLAKDAAFIQDKLYFYRIDNENSSVKSIDKIMCIKKEYEYVTSCFKNRDLYKDEYELAILKRKLREYFWNYTHISENVGEIFLKGVRIEIEEMEEKFQDVNLSEVQKNFLNILTLEETRTAYWNQIKIKRQNMLRILDLMLMNKNLVIASSGKYCEYILFLHNLLELRSVEAVCDNSPQKQGQCIQNYVIQDLDNYIQENKAKRYIIANKRFASEIKAQLLKAGIDEKNIETIELFPKFDEIIKFRKEIEG